MILTQLLVVGLLAGVSASFVFPKNIEMADRMHWIGFNSFAKKYNRQYSSNEEMFKRFQIYKNNMQRAKKLQENEMGTAIYGETKFSDMTPEEFKQTMHPYTFPERTNRRPIDIGKFGVSTTNIPKSVDWRKKHVVTSVKDQGPCGSCWAFSAVGNIEGAWALAKGELLSLSEQEVLDCDRVDHGCHGGEPLIAFQQIMDKMDGLETAEDCPYYALEGRQCEINKTKIAAYINDSVELPPDEDKIAAWLATKGPLSVCLNSAVLELYIGGIINPWPHLCPVSRIDHAVLLVGYGTKNGEPYWLIKNSWAEDWGEKGYFRIHRGTNVCGIKEVVTSAIVN